jgi:hypothetical protein
VILVGAAIYAVTHGSNTGSNGQASNGSSTGLPDPNDDNDKQQNRKPAGNTDQNKRVTDAAREAKLDPVQRRLLGRIVERDSRAGGANYTYQDIKAIADEIKAGRSSY